MKDTGWKQGWIGGASGYAGLPQNVGGRNYSGSNSFFLQMHTAAMNYQLPVYLTFKQAHNLKAHVLKGEKAFPVVYWDMMIKDSHGKKISTEEYRAMRTDSRFRNFGIRKVCTHMPHSTVWWRRNSGFVRYVPTSVRTVPIILPQRILWCCP